MKLSQFQFNLPAGKIATEPPRWRDECKLMVLHKDNSLELYTLPKGKKPSFWHTIDLGEETIKSLPERLTAADKDYWIVRTAIQTLIYPSGGGKPVTKFKDDAMIRTDSKIVLLEEGQGVEVDCYDGKKRMVKLK